MLASPYTNPVKGNNTLRKYESFLKIGAEAINFKFGLYALYDRGVQYIL